VPQGIYTILARGSSDGQRRLQVVKLR
jgi:hypothetical protein